MTTRPRVLVIDDEAGIRALLQKALASLYDVTVTGEAAEGLHHARWNAPHLILLDLRMPEMDGMSVLAKLKSDEHTTAIPVVIVSAKGDTDTLLESQRSGAVDHLIKPFDLTTLHDVVKRNLLIAGDAS